MAETKIVTLDVNSNLEQTTKSVGSLKAQLREAQNEVAALSDKFGATSKEAVEAAKRAGELKDKIGDAKALTDAFNPDAKFKSLTASLSGAAGGLAAVTGAYGLLGGQSKEVEGLILKVQSAMALSSGLQAVGESVDSFRQLRAVVSSYTLVQKISTAAQWLWNVAMSANPLGAIVLVIAAVIAAGYKLISFFMESAAANETAMAATKKNTNALKEQEKSSKSNSEALKENNDKQYALAKASGASAEELRKLALKHAEETIALNKKNTMLARSTFLREADTLAALKANDASDEVIAAQDALVKKSYESFDKQRDGLYASYKDRRKVITENEVEVAQEATDRRKKESDEARKHRDELLDTIKEANKKTAKEDADAITKKAEEKKKTEQEAYDAQQKALKERNDAELKSLDEIDKAKKANEDRGKTEQQLALEAENATYQLKLDNANKFGQDTTELTLQHTNNITDINKKASESNIKLAEAEAAAKMAQIGAVANALDGLAKIAGEKTAAGKALAIAAATINTFKGISEVWGAASMGNPIVDMAVKIASTAIVAVQGIANVKKIMAVQIPGGGGGGGSAPTAGATPAAPSFNVVGNSGVNQIAGVMQQQGVPVVKTYVTAGDVTTAQGLNRNIVSNATLG